MSADIEAAARALADILADVQAGGLPVEAEVLEQLRQGTGLDDAALALAALAEDPEACEHAPLLALLYSPGAALRLALEPLLPPRSCAPQELAAEVLRLLAGRTVHGRLPDGARLPLSPRPEDILHLALRLRPDRPPPRELREALARRFADGTLRWELCALLRHGRVQGADWTPERQFFAGLLLERLRDQDDARALFGWALAFLDLTRDAGLPLREALAARHEELERLLRQAEAREEERERMSFELRMSQGMRAGHLHAPDLREELHLLERAAQLVYGLRPGDMAGPERVDLGQALDADELLRLLPRG